MPLFLIPVGFAAIKAAATAAAVTKAVVIASGAVLAGTAVYNTGRRKGQAEGKESLAAEIQAHRARLDEMEAGL